MKYIYYVLTLCTAVCFTACEKAILGEEGPNNPEQNFETLWEDFDKHYALFGVKSVDWNALYAHYRPMVTPQTSDEELWDITTQMLDHLNDGHVQMTNGNGEEYESGDSILYVANDEFDFQLILDTYSDYHYETSDEGLTFGKIKDKDIGYIHMFDMEGPDGAIVDDILNELSDYKALIIDLRNNSGGDDEYAHRFAGAFADGKHFIYTVQTRNGENHHDFDEKTKWYTKPEGKVNYTKPVVLLTSKFVVSGAEIFTLNMKAFGNVTHIGDTTKGDHSDLSRARFLPNGWVYYYSNQLYLMPNGQSLEGIGIAPDIYIRNSKADVLSGKDEALERSIQFLFDEYGVE